MVLVIIAAIAIFLVAKAIPAINKDTANFFTYKEWFTDGDSPKFGIAATVFGTILTAAVALILAVPVALGIALCLSHYADRRVATVLGFVIDRIDHRGRRPNGRETRTPVERRCQHFALL